MPTFLHAADIHLDSPLLKLDRYEGAPVEDLRGATRRAFENLVRLALDRHVDFVLISGDLYDGDWKDYNTGLYFMARMARLREAEIPVFLIAGNHDAASKMTKTLRLPDNVRFLSTDKPETVRLDHLGVALHGQGFGTPSVTKDISLGYPEALSGYFNIGMLHTCLTGREGHAPYAPCSVEGLRSRGYDYWALGHVHQREIIGEESPMVFPGNIQGRHIRETGPKGCMLVTVGDGVPPLPEFRPLDVVRWERCEIDASETSGESDVADLIYSRFEALLDHNEDLPLVVRVEITGACGAHAELTSDPERWINEVRSLALDAGGGRIWVEKVKLRTTPPPGKRGEPTDGPVGELLRFFDEIRSDPERLQTFGASLDDLWNRLPKELRTEEKIIAPDDPEWLASVLEQVRPMLLRRLMSGGSER